jgi:hypothetical protein
MSPAEFWVGFWKWAGTGIGLCVLGVVAIGALVIGGWQANWWFASHNATRSYQVQQEGVNNQDTTRANITQWFGNLTQENVQLTEAQTAKPLNPTLVGQIKIELAAQADDICAAAENISGVPLPADQAKFVTVNCQDGVVISTSPYFIPGAV